MGLSDQHQSGNPTPQMAMPPELETQNLPLPSENIHITYKLTICTICLIISNIQLDILDIYLGKSVAITIEHYFVL